MNIKVIQNDIATLWNTLADRFNTHKVAATIHPDAAVNIHVGWPTLFHLIENQTKFLGKKNCIILDFGCGAGEFCSKLSEMGHTVTGLDHSQGMLTYAKEHIDANIKLIHGNHHSSIFDNPKYKDHFDIITAIHSLEWVEDIDIAMENLAKLLAPRGLLLFAVFPKSHITDSIKIHDLFEGFDSSTDPKKGYANFDGVKVPVYIRDAAYFDKLLGKLGFEKVIEYYPQYPKSFFEDYKWTGSKEPEMMILAYRKRAK